MHIAFLTTEYPPGRSGGIGTFTRTLGTALSAAGHRVSVVGWGPEPRRFEDEGVAVHFVAASRLPRSGWLLNRLRARRELRRLARRQGLDVVEAADWCGPSAGIRLPCPLVVRCHGSAAYFGELLDEPVRRSVRRAEALALRGAAAVAAVSRFTAERTRALFGLPQTPRVIHNAVDVDRFRPAPAGDVHPGRALYLGTLVRKKGVLDLCRGFDRLVRQHPEATLRLVGRDAADRRSGSPSTFDLCRAELGPAGRRRLEYPGPVPYDAVPEEIARAAVCVFPSWAEALPLSWLEAMACGRPIVAYDIGWAREIVTDGVDGLLVAPGDVQGLADAVGDLLASPARAAAIGAAARATIEERFSTPRLVERSCEWYRSVIAGRSIADRSPAASAAGAP